MSKRRGLNGEATRFIKEAEKLGCVIEFTRGAHLRIRLPNGDTQWSGSSPSDCRSTKNALAKILRILRERTPT